MKNSIRKLPIALKEIDITDFKGIKHANISDLPENAQWVFLTGENGFGKTSLLQAIAAGLNFEPPIPGFNGVIKCRFLKKGQYHSFKSSGIPSYIVLGKKLSEFVAYGASRIEIAHDTSSNEAKGKSGPTYSIFNSDGVLLSIEAELKTWEYRDHGYFQHLKNTMLKVLDKNIVDIEIDKKTAEVLYVEADENGNRFPAVSFQQLASGFRSIIAMAGDLLIRFYQIYSRDIPPEEFEGIVLIDELDVHLHPKLQQKIPGILSEVFPKIQFIVSTHSPIPLLGAPANSVFLKVGRDQENGVQIHRLDYVNVKNLTPNTILTSPIFDFDKIIPSSIDKLEDLVTQDNYNEAVFNKILVKKLKELAEEGGMDPEKILKKK